MEASTKDLYKPEESYRKYNFRSFDVSSSYSDIVDIQELIVSDFFKKPLSKEVYKLIGEHPPTYTCGRSMKEEDFQELLKSSQLVDVARTERGGQLMYHGPGQLTFYFIFNLKEHFSGPKDYVDSLFEALKQYFLNRYDLDLEYRNQGLWRKDKKVGFMGIRVKKGVVYHGLSLNYFTKLEPFLKHSPCDIKGEQAGNLFSSPLSTMFFKDEAQSILDSLPFF